MIILNKPINEILVQFSGKACIPAELKEDVVLKVIGSVVAETEIDNQNGTKDKIQRVKIISVENI